MIEQKTTLTLKDNNGEYQVSVSKGDMTIDEIVEQLLKPLLLASTFTVNQIEDYFGGGDD